MYIFSFSEIKYCWGYRDKNIHVEYRDIDFSQYRAAIRLLLDPIMKKTHWEERLKEAKRYDVFCGYCVGFLSFFPLLNVCLFSPHLPPRYIEVRTWCADMFSPIWQPYIHHNALLCIRGHHCSAQKTNSVKGQGRVGENNRSENQRKSNGSQQPPLWDGNGMRDSKEEEEGEGLVSVPKSIMARWNHCAEVKEGMLP